MSHSLSGPSDVTAPKIRTRITFVATLISGNGRKRPQQQRRRAFALGARSAFDLSGMGTLRWDLFGAPPEESNGPSEMVIGDLARVLRTFGLSLQRGQRAVAAGRSVDDLEPGCTTRNGDFGEHLDKLAFEKSD